MSCTFPNSMWVTAKSPPMLATFPNSSQYALYTHKRKQVSVHNIRTAIRLICLSPIHQRKWHTTPTTLAYSILWVSALCMLISVSSQIPNRGRTAVLSFVWHLEYVDTFWKKKALTPMIRKKASTNILRENKESAHTRKWVWKKIANTRKRLIFKQMGGVGNASVYTYG